MRIIDTLLCAQVVCADGTFMICSFEDSGGECIRLSGATFSAPTTAANDGDVAAASVEE